MKKIKALLFSAATVALTAFTACSEAKFEMHQTGFYPTMPNGMTLYADQTLDSLKLHSFDPWTLESQSATNWFQVNPNAGSALPGSSAFTTLNLTTTFNTTGKTKTGKIVVTSYDNNQFVMPVKQRPWLDVRMPAGSPIGNTVEDQTIRFASHPLPATSGKTQIIFRTYQAGATLTSKADWAQPEKTAFDKGQHDVNIVISSNQDKENSREAELILTSGGISTSIYIKQEAAKK